MVYNVRELLSVDRCSFKRVYTTGRSNGDGKESAIAHHDVAGELYGYDGILVGFVVGMPNHSGIVGGGIYPVGLPH